jgi:prepilin-type processing-associated H-X9-DG protein
VKLDDLDGSMLLKLMPYLEEGDIYDQLDFDDPNVSIIGQFNDPANAHLRSAYLAILRCPSDTFPSHSEIPNNKVPHAVTNYASSIGAQKTFSLSCPEPEGDEFKTGDDVSHESQCVHSANKTSGLFARIDWAASIPEITDGTSKTIAMGEVLPDCNLEFIRFGWWDSQAFYVATVPPINFDSCRHASLSDQDCSTHANWNTSAGFKSRHPSGANFTFADGSVHFISENIDYRNYQRLGDRRDGEALEPY